MNFIKTFARYKVYFERSRGYAAWGSFFLLIITTLKVHEDTDIGQWINGIELLYYNTMFVGLIHRFPIVIGCIILIFFVLGFYDKIYVRPHEQAEIIKTNPVFMDMKRKIDEIHKKL